MLRSLRHWTSGMFGRRKRDETDKTIPKCHTFCRIFIVISSVYLILSLMHLPPKETFRVPDDFQQLESLPWKFKQWNVSHYILPDSNTQLLFPNSPCNDSVFLAVVICSSVPNFDARQAIRDTWAQDATVLSNIRVLFLLGRSSDETLNALVANESQRYSDIIQQDFLDTYDNLTLKSVMLLKWVGKHCTNAKYVMKTDDDMFVHLPNLFRVLRAKGHQKMLMGCRITGAVPIRNENSKWFAPYVAFPESLYPPYLSGTGYVMSRDAVPLLYRTALATPFFYLEDIFITGISATQAGLKPEDNGGFQYIKRKNTNHVFKSLITAHMMTPKELRQVWNNLHQ